MSAERRRVRAVFRGRVQGVNFRSHTASVGKKIGVTGWVRNLEDGSVELEAQGSPVQIREFLGQAETGSTFARVESVLCEDLPAVEGEDSFHVRR